jgi:hypothetical protein
MVKSAIRESGQRFQANREGGASAMPQEAAGLGPTALHFPSKRDIWLVVLLWAAAISMVVASVDLISSPLGPVGKAALVGFCLGIAVLVLWILYATTYTLTNQELLIHCGPFRTRVDLNKIKEIFPSHNPLSSPACSLDRLHIKYKGSWFGVLISPENKREFLQAVVQRCPALQLEGERAVRIRGA